MKKLLFTIALLALSTLASARPEGDTITQPILVVGRQLDGNGNVIAQYNLDFSYNLDGTLKEFNFPHREKTRYHYYGDSIYYEETLNYKFTYWGEDNYWYYDKSGKLERMEHLWQNNYFESEYFNYYYDEHDRLVRKDWGLYPSPLLTYWTWEYSEDGREVTEYYWTRGGTLMNRYTYLYDDVHTLLSKQVDKYDSGALSWTNLTTYSYTPSGKLESEVKRNLTDGQWVNYTIVNYVYDDKDRVTEISKGSWSEEEQSWHFTKREVLEYNEEEMKTTISFLKLAGDQWVRDNYSSDEPIFFDPPMNTVHQRAMRFLGNSFYLADGVDPIDPVNQLEVTCAFTGIPNYMDVPQASKTDVAVYPNPDREEVTVRANTERAVVRFYDQQGRLLVSKPFDFSTTVGTGNWTPGLYIWEVWHDTQREASGKWIKK